MEKRYSFNLKKYGWFLNTNLNNSIGSKPVFTGCFLLLTLFLTYSLQAQDLIVKLDQTTIDGQVVKVTPEVVQYKKAGTLDKQLLSISKAEVYMIIYKNGRTEIINPSKKPAESTPPSRSAKPTYTPPSRSESALLPDVEETSLQPTGKVIKNPTRLMLGAGIYPAEHGWVEAPKIAFEKVNVFGLTNFGIGFSGNLLINIYNPVEIETDYQGVILTDMELSKLYASLYLFKEFDTKFITFGLLAGPAGNYTWGYLYFYGSSEYFTGGLHTGQYLHKYLSTNKKGQRNLFLRLSFEQYTMLEGSYTHVLNLTIGL